MSDLLRGVYRGPKVERPETASQTLLAHLDRCPYSGGLYLRHKGGPRSAAMARGEAFHEFAEQATNQMIEAGEAEMPPEVGKDLMQAILSERVDLAIPADEQDACRLMAWNWSLATFLDLESIVSAEGMLEMQIGEWTVRGKLDLLQIANGVAIVDDYKTSKAIETKESYENSFQAQMYSLLALEGVPEGDTVPIGKGLSGAHTRQLYPRYRRDEDGQLVHRYADYDRAQLHDFKRTIESLLRKLDHGLATGEWAAQDGSHCAVCPARSECPIPEGLRDVKVIDSAYDAVTVARRLETSKAENAADTKALKAWVDDNGRLLIGDEAWDFHIERRENADKDAIKALIEESERNAEDFYRVSESTRFKRARLKEAA